MISDIKFILSVITLQIVRVVSASCSVQVQPTWPPIIHVPSQPSIVMIDCLPDDNAWRIGRNSSDGRALLFREEFNMFGFYLTEDTRFLTINDTAVNNNTLIRCTDSQSEERETILNVHKPTLNVMDIGAQRVNISWSQLPPSFNTIEYFNLTINKNHVIQESLMNRTFFEFSSIEDDSSCSNFTFSLSSTLSSPIHSGNCVSLSNVVQRPLPSLPNITSLESSITYSLYKQPGGIVLTVSFLPAFACTNKYRVTHYTIELMGQNGVIKSNSTNEFNSLITITANELNENANYSFQIITSNDVGNRSTGYETFFTTDVQSVTATALENENAFVVQCDFITGSTAQGCMVVLVTFKIFGNITVNVTRNNPCTIVTMNETLLSLNDTQVFGFDIDSDGSVGSLAIRGKIEGNMNATCPHNINNVFDDSSRDIMIAVTFTLLGSATIIITIVIMALLYHYKVRRSSLKHSNTTNGNQEQENIQDSMSGPVYADLVKTKTPGDGDNIDNHYNTTSHVGYEEKEDVNSSNNNNYSELNEDSTTHIYHVLENNGDRPQKGSEDIAPDPDAPELPPPFKPDPPPVYQDINGMPYMQEESAENEYATVKK